MVVSVDITLLMHAEPINRTIGYSSPWKRETMDVDVIGPRATMVNAHSRLNFKHVLEGLLRRLKVVVVAIADNISTTIGTPTDATNNIISFGAGTNTSKITNTTDNTHNTTCTSLRASRF